MVSSETATGHGELEEGAVDGERKRATKGDSQVLA